MQVTSSHLRLSDKKLRNLWCECHFKKLTKTQLSIGSILQTIRIASKLQAHFKHHFTADVITSLSARKNKY
jgi:hypothetical protein